MGKMFHLVSLKIQYSKESDNHVQKNTLLHLK